MRVVAVAVLLVACSRGAAPDPAARACRAAFPGATVRAYATTAGAVRAQAVGPATRPAATAFPGVPDGSAASWCWVAGGTGETAYGVVAGQPPVTFGTAGRSARNTGAPAFP
jgi:hypothetical protein